jgi:hypothetical protein
MRIAKNDMAKTDAIVLGAGGNGAGPHSVKARSRGGVGRPAGPGERRYGNAGVPRAFALPPRLSVQAKALLRSRSTGTWKQLQDILLAVDRAGQAYRQNTQLDGR